jgi:hypothetical protein
MGEEVLMRILALVLVFAACSDPPVPDGVDVENAPITVVSIGCRVDDLRLYSGTFSTGGSLCLRGRGSYTGLQAAFPRGIQSVRTGVSTALFGGSGIWGESLTGCSNYDTVDSIVQGANGVTRLLAPSPPPVNCP